MITELRRRLGQGSVAMVAALALTMPAAGTAVAATPTTAPATSAGTSAAAAAWSIETVGGCNGTRIRHKPIKAGSHTIGYLNVYREGGKQKCAKVVRAGVSRGKWRYTTIKVWNPDRGSVSNGNTVRYNTPGIRSKGITCIKARGTIKWNGTTRAAKAHACTG